MYLLTSFGEVSSLVRDAEGRLFLVFDFIIFRLAAVMMEDTISLLLTSPFIPTQYIPFLLLNISNNSGIKKKNIDLTIHTYTTLSYTIH